MANAFNIPDLLAREALRVAHEKSVFIGTVDRQYDESFKSKGGWKPGDQLRVASPNMYTRTKGSRVMDVQTRPNRGQPSPWRRRTTLTCGSIPPSWPDYPGQHRRFLRPISCPGHVRADFRH